MIIIVIFLLRIMYEVFKMNSIALASDGLSETNGKPVL